MTSILRRIIDAKKRSIVVKIRLPLSLRFIVNFLSSYVFALYSSISEDETCDIGLLKYDSKTPEMMKSILSYLLVLRRQSNN